MRWKCAHCGRTFVAASKSRVKNREYCSRHCKYEAEQAKIYRACEQCGDIFRVRVRDVKLGRGKYCSIECFSLAKTIRKKHVCEFCNKTFFAKPSRAKQDRHIFCSQKCYWAYKSLQGTVEVLCAGCGGKFKMHKVLAGRCKRHWCSLACRKKNNRIWLTCEVCHKEFRVLKSKLNYCTPRFCSRECTDKGLSGEGNSSWLGGRSYEPYSAAFNVKLKAYVKQRDGYECVLCENKEGLAVHHIDYDKDNSDPSNLITLCRTCHGKTNFDRDYWLGLLSGQFSDKLHITTETF